MQISFQPSPEQSLKFGTAQRNEPYETPSKKSVQQTAQKTLKKAILQKIEGSKFNSSNKRIKRNLQGKQIKEQQKSTIEEEALTQQKQLILRNQSHNNPGFYEYVHWMKLHAESFAYVDKKYVEELWKILRLINYGEVFIPTGLVYQLYMDVKRNTNLDGFETIINTFLKENETSDQLKSFKDIKNYMNIKNIQKAYKCLLQQKTEEFGKRVRCQSASNVFERNFKQAKTRTDKKITKICANMIQQARNLKQKPTISVYKSESYQSLVKPERICRHSFEHKFKSQEQKYLEQNNGVLNNLFRAKQLDKSIFEGNIDHIPGVLSHLSRNQYCQAEKLKAQREAQRPQYSKKKIY